jgi:hypothetical protein
VSILSAIRTYSAWIIRSTNPGRAVARFGVARILRAAPEAWISLLDRVAAGVEGYNEEVMDVDIGFDLELLLDLRNLVATQSDGIPDRDIPDDPWPVD